MSKKDKARPSEQGHVPFWRALTQKRGPSGAKRQRKPRFGDVASK